MLSPLKKTSLDTFSTLIIVILLGGIYLFLWLIQIRTPAISSTADFIAFYAAGEIARQEDASQVYDIQKQYQVEKTVINHPIDFDETYPFNHLPFLIPVLQSITSENYIASFTRWALILVAITISGILILLNSLNHFSQKEKVIVGSGLFLFFPSTISIIQGQDSAILLLGVSLWMDGLIKKNNAKAGLGLALATVRPHIALMLALPFFWKERKIFLWFLAGSSLLSVFSIFLIGIDGTIDFINILMLSSSGNGFQMHPAAMFNIVGLIARATQNIAPKTLEILGWALFLLGIIALSIVWKISDKLDERHIIIAILTSIVAAPHLHYHDLVLLLIPIVTIIRIESNRENVKRSMLIIIPLLIAYLLFINHYLPNLYLIPYILMAMLFIWTLFSKAQFKDLVNSMRKGK